MKSHEKLTPLLKQFYAIKNQNPGRILFFRMGDFYELFGDDAVTASSVLGITLTSRSHGDSGKIPLAGIPHFTLNKYLTKILKAGYKVAVCDQVEDPKKAKGIVKREVVEVFTPGSITLDGALDDDKPNFLASINLREGLAGMALLDISTGRFLIDEFDAVLLEENLMFYSPTELIIPESEKQQFRKIIDGSMPQTTLTPLDNYHFETSMAYNSLLGHFKLSSLDGFGLGGVTAAVGAAGAALAYVNDLKKGRVGQVTTIEKIRRDKEMELDTATIRNLELVETPYEGRKNSLLDNIDNSLSAGGGRLLRNWVLSPLKDLGMIKARQRAVKIFSLSSELLDKTRTYLRGVPDMERLSSKVAAFRAGPRDLFALKTGLQNIENLKMELSSTNAILIEETINKIVSFEDLIDVIDSAISDDPPPNVTDGNLFKRGFSEKLDNLMNEIDIAKKFIHELQKTERENTGINSLKVGFNRVFGYYIEVTKPHLSKVPQEYIRKQTLVSAERFITEELKVKEELILNAEEKIKAIELELFDQIIEKTAAKTKEIQAASRAASVVDVIAGFAVLQKQPGYLIPELNESMKIEIKDSRHPVMERNMLSGEFVSNDVYLDGSGKRMAIITGPNMAGKSTYLRQIGLIVLLAQIGSPVPAKSARIGICDRIFTRVGASDDILRGRSTFMVEMTEAAAILNNATDRSLILLDELGRGTSTYDGLAIAWALIEYLNKIKGRKARTLFATHYHELIDLAENTNGIFNLRVAIKEWEGSIVFLYKIEAGGCDDSYGVQVAKLAGLPQRLLDRALEILQQLESGHSSGNGPVNESSEPSTYQISLFSPEENIILNELGRIDPNKLTPMEALALLNKLKDIADREKR